MGGFRAFKTDKNPWVRITLLKLGGGKKWSDRGREGERIVRKGGPGMKERPGWRKPRHLKKLP